MLPVEAPDRSFEGELERVLDSTAFRRSVQLARFLRFIVEQAMLGAGGVSKETVIAMAIFGRRADYDPSCDPVVRVEARRLRRKLAEYYAHEGRENSIRIELPKGGYVPRFISTGPGDTPEQKRCSVAVLPFADRSATRGLEAIADGLTARLIARLGVRHGDNDVWRIVSTSSVFRFKNLAQDPRKIGEELQADCVLEGSLRRAGRRMRCDTQLISCRDGLHLWAGSFETEHRDAFAVEDEFADLISRGLREVRIVP